MGKFPLWKHASGQWGKKYKGHTYYFGNDKEAALLRFAQEWPAIRAGRRRVTTTTGPVTIDEVMNRFLESKRSRMEAGEISAVHYTECLRTCRVVKEYVSEHRDAGSLTPEEFATLRNQLAKRYGPVTLGNVMQRIRSLFKYAYDSGLLASQVRFGPAFKKPSRRAVRLSRAEAGEKMIDPDALRLLIREAKTPLDAMILLALNCGFGQMDCSELPKSALTRPGWIEFRRPKTGESRRCPLWPETQAAIERALASRPDAIDKKDDGLVFITKYGRRFVRFVDKGVGKAGIRSDGISLQYNKLKAKLALDAKSFYALRHVHRTVADGAKDASAAMLIMGHVDSSISGVYRERIDDERLVAVSELVRKWLFG